MRSRVNIFALADAVRSKGWKSRRKKYVRSGKAMLLITVFLIHRFYEQFQSQYLRL